MQPTTAKKLKEVGIVSLMDLASADELDLAEGINIPYNNAASFIMAAQKLLDDLQQKEDHCHEIPDFAEEDENMDHRNERIEDYVRAMSERDDTVAIPIEQIVHPPHIRKKQEEGFIYPIVVRPMGDDFEVVSGNRRLKWALGAGLEKIPVIVRNDITDTQVKILQFHEACNPSAEEMKDFGERVEELYQGLRTKNKCTREWVCERLKELEGGSENKPEETGTQLESCLNARVRDIERRRLGDWPNYTIEVLQSTLEIKAAMVKSKLNKSFDIQDFPFLVKDSLEAYDIPRIGMYEHSAERTAEENTEVIANIRYVLENYQCLQANA